MPLNNDMVMATILNMHNLLEIIFSLVGDTENAQNTRKENKNTC